LGRGGRAFFALDVTNPATLTEANASNIFKWMFSASDDADLGYAIADVKLHPERNQATPIVRMNNGKFAVLLPNGPGSAKGKAFLFVLFVDGPDNTDPNNTDKWVLNTNYIKIPTDDLTGNGLMGVNWVDSNKNGTADTIYATDLLGRVWKFDVSSATPGIDVSSTIPSNWKSAYSNGTTPVPLFEAKQGDTRLPISTAPALAFPTNKGTLVIVGTGKSIETDDFSSSSLPQRVYAIYDNNQRNNSNVPVNDLSKFAPRTLTRTSTGDVIVSKGNKAFNPQTDEGWYIDFAPASSTSRSEMVLSSPELRYGTIFLTGTRPSNDTTKCYNEALNTNYAFDPYTGTPQAGWFGSTLVDSKKVNLIGQETKNQKSFTASYSSGSTNNLVTGGNAGTQNSSKYTSVKSRTQWREITGMRSTQ
jgi:type IV pilus assembly protein PilY1